MSETPAKAKLNPSEFGLEGTIKGQVTAVKETKNGFIIGVSIGMRTISVFSKTNSLQYGSPYHAKVNGPDNVMYFERERF